MKPLIEYKTAVWLGILTFFVFVLFVGLSHAIPRDSTDYDHEWLKLPGTNIRIDNISEKAKIFYWVYWLDPVDDYGNPFIDHSTGLVTHEWNIMGGELDAGESVTSSAKYKPGKYYLVWSEAVGCCDNKMTEFTIEPGTETYVITIYSSGE